MLRPPRGRGAGLIERNGSRERGNVTGEASLTTDESTVVTRLYEEGKSLIIIVFCSAAADSPPCTPTKKKRDSMLLLFFLGRLRPVLLLLRSGALKALFDSRGSSSLGGGLAAAAVAREDEADVGLAITRVKACCGADLIARAGEDGKECCHGRLASSYDEGLIEVEAGAFLRSDIGAGVVDGWASRLEVGAQ